MTLALPIADERRKTTFWTTGRREGVVGYLKRGLPPMAMFLFRFEGQTYACNSMLQSFVTNQSRHTMDGWTFEARHGALRFKGEMRATPEQMVLYKLVDMLIGLRVVLLGGAGVAGSMFWLWRLAPAPGGAPVLIKPEAGPFKV